MKVMAGVAFPEQNLRQFIGKTVSKTESDGQFLAVHFIDGSWFSVRWDYNVQ